MLQIFGMGKGSARETEKILARLIDVLDRRADLPALQSLVTSMRADGSSIPMAESIISLDASAILRIPSKPDLADRTLGLGEQLIVPGQVVQEFWNNHLSVFDTVAKSLQKTFDSFQKEVEKVPWAELGGIKEITSGLETFKSENETLFHPDSVRRIQRFLEALGQRAYVPFVPRMRVDEIARQRKQVKTPPGFLDSGDGDFFVWADTLFGALRLQARGLKLRRLILVTNDKKMDWCREGKAHPLLHAEALTLLRADFEVWNLEKFARELALP